MDRRIARTREILQDALNSLTLKMGYEAVTITDICDAANVGRSTFYAHFTSKDDLKRSGLEHLRQHLLARQKAVLAEGGELPDRTLSFSLVMLEHARDHAALYRALVNDRGGSVALGFIREMLGDLIRTETTGLPFAPGQDRLNSEFVVQYLVGAFMAVMVWWLDGGAKLAPQQVDAMFRSLTMDGMRSLGRLGTET